jgi:hypothetical protein
MVEFGHGQPSSGFDRQHQAPSPNALALRGSIFESGRPAGIFFCV